MYKNKHHRIAAFTLLELMIVIVILGLLATVVMPRILDRPDKARHTKAQVEIANLKASLGLFKVDTGRYPTTTEGLAALVADPGVNGYNKDGYLDKVPMDPWGHPYVYICPGVYSKDYDLISFGKDGESGGTGFDADIQSWNLEGKS